MMDPFSVNFGAGFVKRFPRRAGARQDKNGWPGSRGRAALARGTSRKNAVEKKRATRAGAHSSLSLLTAITISLPFFTSTNDSVGNPYQDFFCFHNMAISANS
jgi:hypothetical protein